MVDIHTETLLQELATELAFLTPASAAGAGRTSTGPMEGTLRRRP